MQKTPKKRVQWFIRADVIDALSAYCEECGLYQNRVVENLLAKLPAVKTRLDSGKRKAVA